MWVKNARCVRADQNEAEKTGVMQYMQLPHYLALHILVNVNPLNSWLLPHSLYKAAAIPLLLPTIPYHTILE